MEKDINQQEKDNAQRETEEIAETIKTLPGTQRATLLGVIMGMQLATADKAG